MNGTAVIGEPVVVVEMNHGRVSVKKGRIASPDSSHIFADNQVDTVVSGDRPFYPFAESPEEARERSFRVDDIHLLKEQEARSLRDVSAVQEWFGSIYQDPLVMKIHRALKRLLGD
jgi:hypothetical protein